MNWKLWTQWCWCCFFVSTRPIFKKMDIPSRDQGNVTPEQTSDTLDFGFRVWKWYCTIVQNLVSGGDSTTRRHLQTFEWKIEGLKGRNVFFQVSDKIQSNSPLWNTWKKWSVGWAVFWSISAGTWLSFSNWQVLFNQSLSRLGCQTLSGLGFSVVFRCCLTCCQIVPRSHLHIHGVVWKLTRFPKIHPQWPVCSQQSAELRTDEFNPKLSWN